jgi:putative selenium metabolism protein SsnA
MMLLGNAEIVTLDEHNTFIHDGAVLIDLNNIMDIGETDVLRSKYPDAEYYNLEHRLLIPGFLNAHMHLYSTFARGMSIKGSAPSNFKEILEKLWWKLDKNLSSEDEIYFSSLIPLIEGIRCGTTGIIDHHASFGLISGSLDIVEKAVLDIGVRSVLCYETSDRWGKELSDLAIKENVRFIEKSQKERNSLIAATFGLHASLTLSNSTLEKCSDEAQRLNTGFHIHVAEGIEDVQDSLDKSGKRVVNRLNDFGIISDKTLAIHCIHIAEEEIQILAKNRTMVVHNPESNMNNAVGIAPLMEMYKEGVKIGLGTDGYTPSMLESVKVAYILPKLGYKDPRVGNELIENMILHNNRFFFEKFYNNDLGVIKKGAFADLVILDYFPPTPLNETNFFYHMIFGIRANNINSVMVNGDFVLKEKQFTKIDEIEIYSKARKVSRKFWEKM